MDPEQDNKTPDQITDALKVVEKAEENHPEQQPAPAPVVMSEPAAKPARLNIFKQKRFLIGLASLVVVAAAAGVFVLTRGGDKTEEQLASSQNKTELGVVASVVDGTASISKDGENWQELTTESQIDEGDIVRTDALSRVVLAFDDGSAIRLDETTTAELSILNPGNVQINNQSGEVYSRVVESDRIFTVNIQDSSYTALGTAFHTVNRDDATGVKVLQSSVKGSSTAPDVEVEEGKQYFTYNNNKDLESKITDISLEELKSDNFLLWNLEQDEKDDKFKDKLGYWNKLKETVEEEEEAPAASSGISLTAVNTNKGTLLTWTIGSLSAPEGFKIVRSQSSSSPTFGKDEAHHASSPNARSYTWGASKAGTFNYRVCIYRSGSCSNYSNTVTIESPYIPPEAVAPGAVNLGINEEGTISWTYAGTAPHGFKVLVSDKQNPTYPNDAEHYGNSPYTLKNRSSGTYYVRVCKYTASSEISGGCTDYSNEVLWIVP